MSIRKKFLFYYVQSARRLKQDIYVKSANYSFVVNALMNSTIKLMSSINQSLYSHLNNKNGENLNILDFLQVKGRLSIKISKMHMIPYLHFMRVKTYLASF